MSKISIYEVAPVPKLNDKLIGTSVGGIIEDVTYNFTLQELLNLFIPNLPTNTLQSVLNQGNTATQDINLTGTIYTTDLDVSVIATILDSYLTGDTHITGGLFDVNTSIGTAGQVLISTGTGVEWYTVPVVIPNLQQVLTSGNTSTVDIILTSNLSALDVTSDTATINNNITIDGTLTDGTASVGTLGKVLSSTVTGVQWVDLPVYSATSPLFFNSATGVFSIQVANAVQSGYLTSADWITFDGKQNAGNYITALTGEATATGPGSVAITLSNTAVIGKILTGLSITGAAITSTDTILQAFGKAQNQINGKQDTITLTTIGNTGPSTLIGATLNIPNYTDQFVGTVTSVAALTLGTTGTDLSSTVANSTTTPVITLNVPNASAVNRGALISADWTTFNSKQDAITLTTTGSSGASTFISNTLNVPTYTLSGLGGVPTTRQLTINGTAYDLSADRSWSVGTVTSVGITMPAAFSVASSPVTSAGTIAITGAGLASQYIRGDGALGDFPNTGGGGSSVSYYLNGSINQGTFVGNTYYEMNKTPVIGAGTDFTINANGYIAQFITDANDPASLLIPGGNWNVEMYFSASSNGGNPSFYVEVYKYDGTTFTLLGSNSATPEGITNGTAIDIYYTSVGIPETVLTITDRLAIRVYVTHSGRTITLHTEDNHLSEIVTTFSNGLTTLNGLTKQSQYFAVGTTGTDFNISSSVDTHTFNLPTASATNRGALSFTDWTTFNSKQDTITLTTTGTSGAATFIANTLNIPNYADGGVLSLSAIGSTPNANAATITGTVLNLQPADASFGGVVTTGTQTFAGAKTFNVDIIVNSIIIGKGSGNIIYNTVVGGDVLFSNTTGNYNTVSGFQALYNNLGGDYNTSKGFQSMFSNTNGSSNTSVGANSLPSNTLGNNNTAIGRYAGYGTGSPFNNTTGSNNIFIGYQSVGISATESNRTWIGNSSTLATWVGGNLLVGTTANSTFALDVTGTARITGQITLGSTITDGTYTYTLPSATGTLALTSALSAYVPYTGATGDVDLGTNNGITLTDTGSNTSINVTSSSTGQGAILVTKSGNGEGIRVLNGGIGAGFLSANTSTGIGFYINNSSTGIGLKIDNYTSATGDPFIYTLNNVSKAKIDYLGNITGVAGTFTGQITLGSTITDGTYIYTLPGATGTIALVGGAGVGTVTSVSFTLGTSGTDLSSSVTNSTTTPAITLNVPTASASARGALSAADWSTFNSKQGTITLTTTGTSGAATFIANTLNIPNYADGGVLSLSAIGATPNANAATITGTVLNLQPASASFGGVVTTGTQTFGGAKTLTGALSGTTASFSGYYRPAAGTGFLNGGYGGVETTATTGPIYCIGDSYIPTGTTTGTMYGIGYSYNNFTGAYGPASTWGMYVVGGGTVGIFLSAGGAGYFSSTVTAPTFVGALTGNASTATAAQNATFLTQPNATWGGRLQLGGNGANSGVANIAVVQATDGNLHMDGGVGKSMYLNYYSNGIIYLNGSTYNISSNGSQYNGNAATATSASTASTAGTVTHNASRTDGAWYNAVWAAGTPSPMYSCDAVQIQSSTGSIRANIFVDNQDTSYYVDPNGLSKLSHIQLLNNWSNANPNEGAINIRGAYPSMTFRNTISNNMWLRHMDGSGDVQYYFANGVDSNAWSIKHTMFTNGNFYSLGTHTASQFNGSGAGLTGTATSLNIGGNAATVTNGVYTNTTNSLSNSLWLNSGIDVTTLAGILTLYGTGNTTTSQMMFKNTTGLGYGNHGAITGTYNTYFVMDTTDRGWIWRNATTSTNIASISNTGVITATTFSGSLSGTASNVNSISSAVGGTYTWTGINYFRSNQNTSGTSNPLQAYSDSGLGAIMSFHRGGYYAVNMGLDSDNVFRIGGWSAPANLLQLNMAGALTVLGSMQSPTYYQPDVSFYFTVNSGSYGPWRIGGVKNGYSGFIVDNDMQLMIHGSGAGGPCGFYHASVGWSILTYVNADQRLYSNGTERIGTISDGGYITGNLYVTGNVYANYSDIRLKKDVEVIKSAISKIKQLRGVTYTWNDEQVNILKERAGIRDIGLIAQEVQSIEPLLTEEYKTRLNTPSKDPKEAANFISEVSEAYMTVKYEKLVALLVEGIKEQQLQIEELKQSINNLSN